MTTQPKRVGRPREYDGMITRPIAATPEQWATAEAIGTTYAQGARMALDMAAGGMPDVSRMTVEQLHELREAINKQLHETYRANATRTRDGMAADVTRQGEGDGNGN